MASRRGERFRVGVQRDLLFLPGAGGAADFWRPLGGRLPETWSKRYLAWPGLGDQPPAPDVRGLGDLVTLAEHALPAAPADVLAQSMGGVVALQLALRHPERIRRLVLAVTSGGIDVGALGGSDWRGAYRAAFPRAAAWITEPAPDLTTELRRLRQPCLLLWGDADPISPVAVGRQLERLLPDAQLVIFPGGDHDLVQTQAPAVAEIVGRFLG